MNAKIDISNVILKDNDITLREFKKEDLNDLYNYCKVEGVGSMAGWPSHKSIKESKEILDMFIASKKTFAIELDNKVIGSIGIEKYNEKYLVDFENLKGRELGFVLSKDYWGRSIMPKALNLVIKYLFNDLKLDFLICTSNLNNLRSKKVQEKCGFKFFKQMDIETRSNLIQTSDIYILKNKAYTN